MSEDPRLAAARYRAGDAADAADHSASTPEQRAAFVEQSIQQAIRRGEFDDLPGAGRPLQDLGSTHDPDWWMRRKIERERITGLGPPALTLRSEHRDLDRRLDGVHAEAEVRDILLDFNTRVIEARRQLQGGPPVVTPTRDVEHEVRAWRERRDAADRGARERLEAERLERESSTRRARRRARRTRAVPE